MSMKQKLHFVLICLIVRSSSNSDWSDNPRENSSDPIVDDINISALSEDLRNLSDSLKKLKNLILSTGFSLEETNIDDELSPINYDERNHNFFKTDISPIDKESDDKSNNVYKKAKLMLKYSNNKKAAHALLLEAGILGNSKAKSEIAWSLLFGVPFSQNITGASEAFKELSEMGHPEGHTGLAIMHSLGVGIPRSEERALLHYTIAALGGSVWARMALGYRYMYGISVNPSCEKALHYYRDVAETVIADLKPNDAIRNNKISILDEEDKKNHGIIKTIVDVRNFYEMMAEIGDGQAQVNLGKMYYHGTLELESDLNKSLRYFKLAEQNKNVEAIAFIGKIYLEGGDNIDVDYEEAYKYFKKAALFENPLAEAGLGMMYLDGKFVTQDYFKALHYFRKSAEKGFVEAIIYLAKMYFDGTEIGRDYSLAKTYFLLAVNSGHVLAFYYLGKMHENGLGSFRSCMTALELYKSVAEKGRWDSLFVDAYNKYTQRSYKEAFMMFSILAEIGYASGQLNAAMLLDDYHLDLPFSNSYTKSERRAVTYRKAIQYWNRAARQGEIRALTRMGDHYYYGLGVEVNYETAGAYYRHASLRNNNAEAMFNLAYMHQHGIGLPRDFKLAKRFYDLALEMNQEGWLPVRITLAMLKVNQLLDLICGLSFVPYVKDLFGFALSYWDIIAAVLLGIIGSHIIKRRGDAHHV